MTPEEHLAGSPLGLAVHRRVLELLGDRGDVEVRVGRSAVAYRRRRGFAWLWLPGRYLTAPPAELVLSISLGRHHPSPRFKEVVHPGGAHWMHHLEIRAEEDVDDEVAGWLREAAAGAA